MRLPAAHRPLRQFLKFFGMAPSGDSKSKSRQKDESPVAKVPTTTASQLAKAGLTAPPPAKAAAGTAAAASSAAAAPSSVAAAPSPTVVAPACDETMHLCRSIEESLIDIARSKLDDVKTTPEQIGLACDTLVLCGGDVLGKPVSAEHARRMLELQLEVGHQDIVTGIALRTNGKLATALARARVSLREGARVSLDAHLADEAWQNIAGGYDYRPDDPSYQLTSGALEDVWGMPVARIAELLTSLT